MKTLIVGLDGMDYNQFREFSAGMLFLTDVAQRGSFGMLYSDVPFSPSAWTTIFTGVSQAKHNVTQFEQSMTRQPYPLLWDVGSEHGLSFGILNVPMTFSIPMQRLRSGWLVAGEPRPYVACAPEEISGLLEGQPPSLVDHDGEGRAIGRTVWVLDNFRRLNAARPVDVGIVVLTFLDEFGHGAQRSWSDRTKRKQMRDQYVQADRIVKGLMDDFAPDHLVVLSDHGWNSMAKSKTVYATQRELQESGLPPEDFAYHTREGVLFVAGERVKRGKIDGARTRDVMPTLLSLWGIRFDTDLDGHPLPVLDEDLSEQEREVVEARLQALGYH